MNIALETVVGMKEEKRAANVVPEKVVEKKEIVKDRRVRVSDLMGWESVDCMRLRELVIAAKCCNEEEVTKVDLGRLVSLKVFEVGDECFENVKK